MMRFYDRQHRFYCGIDLHSRTVCVCIRVVLVEASAEHWKNELPMLTVMAIIPVSGDWPLSVDVRCSAGEDELSILNGPRM